MNYPNPPFPKQQQPMPGQTERMQPVPDHGELSHRGCGRLLGKRAVITGADSGIGRAVAIAYEHEGQAIQQTHPMSRSLEPIVKHSVQLKAHQNLGAQDDHAVFVERRLQLVRQRHDGGAGVF